jgi:hypothetical protein
MGRCQKSTLIWFLKSIFYIKNHRNLSHFFFSLKNINLAAHFFYWHLLMTSIFKSLYFLKWWPFLTPPHYTNSQNSMISFRSVDFGQKSFQCCTPRLKTRQPVSPYPSLMVNFGINLRENIMVVCTTYAKTLYHTWTNMHDKAHKGPSFIYSWSIEPLKIWKRHPQN